MITYRTYKPEDYQFLREMIFEAVFWSRNPEDRPSLEEGLSYDYTKFVLEDFGLRTGDLPIIAIVDGKRTGAAFIRYWNDETHIRGYLSEEVPVLAIAVAEEFRCNGIASGLMSSIKSSALENDIYEISLCVTKDNIAFGLYEKSAFKIVEEVDSSYNMLWKAE